MLKYAFATASFAGMALAASSSSCSTSGTTTLSSAADATGVAACSTYSGSVALATGVAGQFDLSGVKTITGDLVANNLPNLSQLSSSSLTKIGGTLNLFNVEILDTINFPQLSSVGSIKWSGLPTLSNIQFASNGLTQGPSISIENTGLSKIDSIFPPLMDSVFIANNNMLQTLTFKVANISDSLALLSNGDRLIVSFPNLEWAQNLTVRDSANVSIPLLKEIRGSIGFYENDFTTLYAPNLTSVADSFALVQNDNLVNTSFPLLTSVGGGFQIANNTLLHNITGFPKLSTVGGAFDCFGNFTTVDVPSLSSVKGAFNVQSSDDVTDTCAAFQKKRSIVLGQYVCAGKLVTPAGEGTAPGKTKSGSTSSNTDTGAAGTNVVSVGVFAVVGAAACLLSMF